MKKILWISLVSLLLLSCSDSRLSKGIIGVWQTSQVVKNENSDHLFLDGFMKFEEPEGGSIAPMAITMIAKQEISGDSIGFTIVMKIEGRGEWKIKDGALSPKINPGTVTASYVKAYSNKVDKATEEKIVNYLNGEGHHLIDETMTELERAFINNFGGFDNSYWPDLKIEGNKMSFRTSDGIETYSRTKDEAITKSIETRQ